MPSRSFPRPPQLHRPPQSISIFVIGVMLGAASMATGFLLGQRPVPPAPPVVLKAVTPAAASPLLEPISGTATAEAGPSPERAPDSPEEVEGDAVGAPDSPAVTERALAFTASIRAGRSYGAGTLIADGVVLTVLHVVEGARRVQVRFHDGDWIPARVLATDATTDLALLEIDSGDRRPATTASALGLRIAEPLLSVGTPRELGFTVHRGFVSFIGRRFGALRFLQTDLPANPGSSGGPVVDGRGRLVGVMSFILRESEGIAFATPVDYALELLDRTRVPHSGAAVPEFENWKSGDAR